MKYKSKTLQGQGRENDTVLYILCQAVWRARKKRKKKKYKVVSSWLSECLKCFPSECF